MRRILVVRTGSPSPEARRRFGEFSEWFERLLAPEVVSLDAVHEEAFPAMERIGGIIVTGSLASVTDPQPWMIRVGLWLLEVARNTPVLGVCFGHQLLAKALGAAVERNPRGPELGTGTIELTPEGLHDPLFAGLHSPCLVQHNHEDHVPSAPPGAVVLARNAHSPVQAFAHGRNLRAVQFHPEFDAARNRVLCREVASGRGLAEAAPLDIQDTPEAERVLGNWVRAYVTV